MMRDASDNMRSTPGRAAYTLVEVMVTVGLVTMMMAILATVFTSATGALNTYQSRSVMDQKARGLVLMVRRDLQRMYIQDDADGWPPVPPVDGGYLCYGEGDLPDARTHADTDDWIQWTAYNPDGEIGAVQTGGAVDDDTSIAGNTAGDGMVRSRVYEVAYYLRWDGVSPAPATPPNAGTRYILYRRVYLVGDQVQPRVRVPAGGTPDLPLHDALDGTHPGSDVSAWPFRDLDLFPHRWGWGWAAGASWPTYSRDQYGQRPCLAQTSDATSAAPGPWPAPYTAQPINWNTATYAAPTRANHDILARDVLSFDVKFWDAYADPTGYTPTRPHGVFVDIGLPYVNASNQVIDFDPTSWPPAGGTAVAYADNPKCSLARAWRTDGAPVSRVFDTWSTDYDHRAAGSQVPYSYDPAGDTHGASGTAPTQALLDGALFPRAIQIKIRLADPFASDADAAREMTIVVDLTKR